MLFKVKIVKIWCASKIEYRRITLKPDSTFHI